MPLNCRNVFRGFLRNSRGIFSFAQRQGRANLCAVLDETAHEGARPKRLLAQKKTEVVRRLRRGKEIDLQSLELRVPAAPLAAWRDAFLPGGQDAMKKQPLGARDRASALLREKLGESNMDHER